MCGILGAFTFDGGIPDADTLARHVAAVRHRGPDDATCWSDGSFFFGHRRLSIIDLATGRQPMSTDDGRLVVTFNGEIYNYVELRQELAAAGFRFHTSSDTEVLLHGYRAWGTDLPSRLVGMFAFGLADMERQQLFMARDRFGEKPLLFWDEPSGVTFASELAPISALMGGRREFNAGALPGYLCLNYVPGDDTLMRGVKRLVPGTWRLYDRGGGVTTGRYWEPPSAPLDSLTMEEAVGTVERLLDEAVRLALRSDVPVGVFLSGGVDSALVASAAARAGHLERAFCLTFDESTYSEWDRARHTAERLGIPLQRVPMGAEALERFLELVDHADDPLADSSSLAVWTLAREASRHLKVVLSGDGGDELFGGYLTYQATRWHNAVTSRLPMPVRRLAAAYGRRMRTAEAKVSRTYKLMRFLRAVDLPPGEAHFTWNGVWLPDEAATLLSPAGLQDAARGSMRALARGYGLDVRPSGDALQRADVQEYLPNDILAKVDRMTMAHGLEARAPLLNPELADYALRIPPRLNLGTMTGNKLVLRAVAESVCGEGVGSGAKQGFSIPVHRWLRGPARGLVDDLLSPESLRSIDVLDVAAIRRAVDAHMSGRRSLGFELWGLMVLVAWHRRHIQGAPSPPSAPEPARLQLPERSRA